MPWYDIVWTDEIEAYIAQHGLEVDDVRQHQAMVPNELADGVDICS